jgi:hypothetical protein
MAKVKMTEHDRMILIADTEGWLIEEDDGYAIVRKGGRYLYWRHDNGSVSYASDNLGPFKLVALEPFLRGQVDYDFDRRAGLSPAGDSGKL